MLGFATQLRDVRDRPSKVAEADGLKEEKNNAPSPAVKTLQGRYDVDAPNTGQALNRRAEDVMARRCVCWRAATNPRYLALYLARYLLLTLAS
jgi:hypothetical protein